MSQIASGIAKLVTFKRQTALGTIAPQAVSQNLRRTSSNLDLKKATYQSNEMKPSQQVSDMRHGVRSIDGTISGEVSVGTYQAFIESMLRQNVLAAATTTALSDVTAASTGVNTGTFTQVAGSYLTQGLKLGMIIRWTGFTAPATANNATNMMIVGLTAKVMTVARLDGQPVVAKAAGDNVTGLEVGKHTFIPQGGHTRDYYTIEHAFQDIAQSEVFTDCVVSQMDIKLPASGMATVDFAMMGLNMQTFSGVSAPYFTAPTAVTCGNVLAAANGVVYLGGVPVGLITGMNISVKGGFTKIGGVVGSNVEPDIFPGKVTVDGQLTVLFQDATIRDVFVNETEVAIYAAFTTDNTGVAGFQAYSMGRVKLGGATKDDGDKGLVMTMPFTALEQTTCPAGQVTNTFPTTLAIQDSAFV